MNTPKISSVLKPDSVKAVSNSIVSKVPSIMANKTQSSFGNWFNGVESNTSSVAADVAADVASEVTNITSDVVSEIPAIEESSNQTIMIILLIVIILTFLGLNVFYYLGDFTQLLTETFGPLFSMLGIDLGNLTKQTVNLSASGTKDLVDIAAGTVDSGINVIQSGLNSNLERNNIDNKMTVKNVISNDLEHIEPSPDESDSLTQVHRSSGKAGFCYIGQDRNVRQCVEVSEKDTCMSGEIFPSQALCINPNLR